MSLPKALNGRDRRLGALWLKAQLQSRKESNFLIETMLRDVEGKLEDEIDVAKLRRDQLLMYALLGDPARGCNSTSSGTAMAGGGRPRGRKAQRRCT